VFRLITELVKREQKALLLATHNPLIARASDFIHEMKDGRDRAQRPAGLDHIRKRTLVRMKNA